MPTADHHGLVWLPAAGAVGQKPDPAPALLRSSGLWVSVPKDGTSSHPKTAALSQRRLLWRGAQGWPWHAALRCDDVPSNRPGAEGTAPALANRTRLRQR